MRRKKKKYFIYRLMNSNFGQVLFIHEEGIGDALGLGSLSNTFIGVASVVPLARSFSPFLMLENEHVTEDYNVAKRRTSPSFCYFSVQT